MQYVTVSIWCGWLHWCPNTHPLLYHSYYLMPFHAFFSHKRGKVLLSSPWIWPHLCDSSGAAESGESHNIPLRARLQEACVLPLASWLFYLPWEKMSVSSFQRTRQAWSRARFPWSSCKGHPRPADTSAGTQLTWNFPPMPNLNGCYWFWIK